jgi:hypothetical protein
MTNEKKPIVLDQSGRVRAKIWLQTTKQGKAFFTIDLYRTYRVTDKKKLSGADDNGYRNTSVFAYEDRDNVRAQLDKAEAVIQEMMQRQQQK